MIVRVNEKKAPPQRRGRLRLPNGLSFGNNYLVVGICSSDFRIINDCNEPVLYHISLFDLLDDKIPADWEVDVDDFGNTYWGPSFDKPGFYEDWFDEMNNAREVLAKYLATIAGT